MVRICTIRGATLANVHSRQHYKFSRLESTDLKELSQFTSLIAPKEVELIAGPVSYSCMV